MKCIYCSHKETEVINSRKTRSNTLVWRRRHCVRCDNVFTTREGTFLDNLFLIKRNGKRERFIYEKLFASIFLSLNIGKNKDSGKDAVLSRSISYTVVEKLRDTKQKTLKTSDVIIIVYKELYKVNHHVADTYMFYSEYRRHVLKTISKTSRT
jgi:transcriptional regulator NrdR family protein